MNLIPKIHRGSNSNAEIKVFNLLKDIDLGHGWTVFHSLNVSEHQYKQWSEIDFVILGPRGIFALEIKGGRIKFEEGIWYFKDRFGEEHKKSEGPFDQAKSGLYSLIEKIDLELDSSISKRMCIGWGVIFPDIKFHSSSPEMPQEIIFDEEHLKNTELFKKYLKNFIAYWNSKGQKHAELSSDHQLLSQIKNYLRPNFDFSPSLLNKIDQINQEIIKHTSEQYFFLDSIETADQIICTGGAGTGKSFLAVETARRELFDNKNLLVTTLHDRFTAFLKLQLKDTKAIVLSFQELQKNLKQYQKELFDVLIVDEAQDLMTMENIEILDSVIRGGIEKGKWRFFMDENAQANILGNFDDDAFNYLKSFKPTPQKLKFNCRNTEQIVNQAELTTGAHIGETFTKNIGIKVNYCKVSSKEDELEQLINQIESCYQEGDISFSDMVILSPVEFNESIVSMLPEKWLKRLVQADQNSIVSNVDKLLFSVINPFKGLERKCVFLVDLDQFDTSKNSKSLLYVAMTRAQAFLWMAVGESFEKVLSKLQIENYKKDFSKNNV